MGVGAIWPDPPASPFGPARDLRAKCLFLISLNCLWPHFSTTLFTLPSAGSPQSRSFWRIFRKNGRKIVGEKDPGFRVRPGFKSQLCCSLNTWHGASQFISLSLGFLNCKNRVNPLCFRVFEKSLLGLNGPVSPW